MCGVAIDVPSMSCQPPPGFAEVMPTPGPMRSGTSASRRRWNRWLDENDGHRVVLVHRPDRERLVVVAGRPAGARPLVADREHRQDLRRRRIRVIGMKSSHQPRKPSDMLEDPDTAARRPSPSRRGPGRRRCHPR